MNPLLISSLIAAVFGFGGAWTWQSYRMDAYKLEVANERIARDRAARQTVERLTSEVAKAQAQSSIDGARLRADAGTAGVSGDGLRDALAAAVRSAHTDLQACTRQVDALNLVFTQCVGSLQTMARDADEWANQAVTLQKAWPK